MKRQRIKNTSHILLGIIIVVPFVSCCNWRDAKEVIAEADSLLVEHKVVTRDTTALLSAINTLDGPLGHVFAREDLAKAYYFMGRNFYYLNDFSTAADYYILCDRMNPSDPMCKGRINSCMGYLCKQDSCFKEALVFYERANVAFEKSGNERRIANGLLSIAEQYINLKQYDKADSVLAVAETYDIDSAYYARMVETKAMYFLDLHQYDSVSVYLKKITNYSRNTEEKCFIYQLVIQLLYRTNQLNQAILYTKYILENSKYAVYRKNAYYVMIDYAKKHQLLQEIAEYSHAREDEERIVRNLMESYAQASLKLSEHLANPYPFRMVKIVIAVGGIVIIIVALGWIIHRKKQIH